jgi:hypothetical protein
MPLPHKLINNLHNLKTYYLVVMALLFSLNSSANIINHGRIPEPDTILSSPDTLSPIITTKTKKEIRNKNKEQRKIELKNSHSRLLIHGAYTFAKLDTRVTFNPPGSIITVTLSLEDQFGLPSNSSFFSGSAVYRFTPTSGIFVNYYGFNRGHKSYTKQDIIWAGDTIKAGTQSEVYFRTQVFSAGYLLSILKKPESFLGAYINFYIMPLSLGVKTDITNTDYNLKVIAPLPNIGLIAMFQLTKWLSVYGNMGFFSLYTKDLGGYIQDLNISFPIRINHWLNLNVSYQRFFVHALFPDERIDTYVDYDYKGPAVGVTLKF